jgi:hypothetical protein
MIEGMNAMDLDEVPDESFARPARWPGLSIEGRSLLATIKRIVNSGPEATALTPHPLPWSNDGRTSTKEACA